VTLVLSREVRAGHESAFEDLLTRAVRPFLYPAQAGQPLEGASPR
jgi:hypothetical protein